MIDATIHFTGTVDPLSRGDSCPIRIIHPSRLLQLPARRASFRYRRHLSTVLAVASASLATRLSPPLAGVHSPDLPIWLGIDPRASAQANRPPDLRRAPKLPELDLDDERGILSALKQGTPAVVDCRRWVGEQARRINARALSRVHVPLLIPSFIQSARRSWNSSELLTSLKQNHQRFPAQWGSWGRGQSSDDERGAEKPSPLWGSAYNAWFGSVNMRELEAREGSEFRLELPAVLRRWSDTQNIAWVGPSRGQLHADAFDNLLVQFDGSKQVICYPAWLKDAVADGEANPRTFDALRFLANSSRTRERPVLWSEARVVFLEPGMGLLLPSMAFHAPVGRTWNSLSINSWFFGSGPKSGQYAHTMNEGAVKKWEPSKMVQGASSVLYSRSMPLTRIKELALQRDRSADGAPQQEQPRRHCTDGPALACAEPGCSASAVSCALLANLSACLYHFSQIWSTPPRGLGAVKVWMHCPRSCKRSCTHATSEGLAGSRGRNGHAASLPV